MKVKQAMVLLFIISNKAIIKGFFKEVKKAIILLLIISNRAIIKDLLRRSNKLKFCFLSYLIRRL